MKKTFQIAALSALVIFTPTLGCRKKPAPAPAPEPNAGVPGAEAPAPAISTRAASKAAPVAFATPESLAQYNVLLQDWVKRASYVPKDLAQLQTAIGAPKIPPAPPGRALVYDPKTITVRLQ